MPNAQTPTPQGRFIVPPDGREAQPVPPGGCPSIRPVCRSRALRRSAGGLTSLCRESSPFRILRPPSLFLTRFLTRNPGCGTGFFGYSYLPSSDAVLGPILGYGRGDVVWNGSHCWGGKGRVILKWRIPVAARRKRAFSRPVFDLRPPGGYLGTPWRSEALNPPLRRGGRANRLISNEARLRIRGTRGFEGLRERLRAYFGKVRSAVARGGPI